MTIERRSSQAEVRSVNKEQRTIDVIASTFAIDSYGTRIDPNGWELEQFHRNPVITWAHDDRGFTASGGRPIAKALPEFTRVQDGELKMRLMFPQKGIFPFADEVFGLLADGFLNAVSVGFEPIESKFVKEGDQEVRIFTKQRLLELAVVTIPSNDEALAERAKRQNQELPEVKLRVENLERMAKEETQEARFGTMSIQVRVTDLPAFEKAMEEIQKCRSYMEKKQPVNKAASKVLKKFYSEVLGDDPPDDEAVAWTRMGEAIESMEPVKEEEPVTVELEADAVVETVETPLDVPAPEPVPVVVEAPQPERKASVQIPVAELLAFPERMTKALADAGVEALRRGVPIKETKALIDGMQSSVSTSFTFVQHGNSK